MLFLEFINEFCGTYVAYYLGVYSYIAGRTCHSYSITIYVLF